MEKLPLSKAITAGMRKAMEDDPKVVLIGEDIGKLGGVFRVTEGLQKDFGPQRVIDAPLAESGIVGTSIGMAIRGYRPVIEIQFDAFIFPAYDQIVTQVVEAVQPHPGQGAHPDGHPGALRRGHRLAGAPLGEPGDRLRPPRRSASLDLAVERA
jgi:pyruvate/2-oxoglutarate/acetoin dehydrogenase E1 component